MTKRIELLTLFIVCTMAVVAWIILGCSYSLCLPFDSELEDLNTITFFEEATSKNDFSAAFSLLTNETQSKLDYEKFSSTPGDFEGIVNSFRSADITTRNWRPKLEPGFIIKNLRGQEGVIHYVLRKEDGKWKIANIVESAPEKKLKGYWWNNLYN